MKGNFEMDDSQFDVLLGEMREERVAGEAMAAAVSRVRQKLVTGTVACSEFQTQLEPYLHGQLVESRKLLLEDHLARCSSCRRAFAELKGERKVVAIAALPAAPKRQWTKWAIAAAAALAALYLGRDRIDQVAAGNGPRATVETVAGSLYRVSGGVLPVGATLSEAETVRTGAGSRAILRLADGSRMEMNERTELAVRAAWSGQSVLLARGDVIVEAAKQRRGRLRVITDDSTVAVKGTIFAVSAGSSGSLVAVVEGSVAVDTAGSERLLKPGQQTASTSSLASVPVKEAVSWSADAAKYYAVLAELMQIEKQLAMTTSPSPLRTQAVLLPYLPAAAIAYLAMPNFGETLREAVGLVEQRSRDNAVLQQWWSSGNGAQVKDVLAKVQTVAPLLGDEVVAVLVKETEKSVMPLVLAKVKSGQQDALRQAFAEIGSGLPYQVDGDLLIASDSAAHVAALRAALGGGSALPFAQEIAQRYQRGVGLLAGVDLSVIRSAENGGPPADAAALLGLNQMKHAFFEQRDIMGTDGYQATLTFKGARKGAPSWLGAPGPAGSAEYIASDALVAMSASTRNPRQVFEEIVAVVETNASQRLAEFESKTGVNLANDVFGALGTDFSIAFEKAAVVVVAEVNQPAIFDSAVRRFVEAFNREESDKRLLLSEAAVNGRTWMSLKSEQSGLTLTWTYDRGFVVGSTDRAVAEYAIATRDSGFPLIRSGKFREQLPAASGLHNSAFLWANTAGAFAGLEGLVEGSPLRSVLQQRDPVLVILDGETERIRASSRTRLTSLLLDLLVAKGPRDGASGSTI